MKDFVFFKYFISYNKIYFVQYSLMYINNDIEVINIRIFAKNKSRYLN